MQDRDYHELFDAEQKRVMNLHKLADAKELPMPASIKGEVTNLKEPVTEGGAAIRQGAALGGRLGAGPTLTFQQLPDGRSFYTVELPAGAYDAMTMADRQALLDGVLADIRARLAKLWSIG